MKTVIKFLAIAFIGICILYFIGQLGYSNLSKSFGGKIVIELICAAVIYIIYSIVSNSDKKQ